MSHAFHFICQHGELEIKSALLAASLHYFLQGKYQLIAALPTPTARWNTPRPQTIDFLQQLGVQFFEINNQIADDYPIGNKVSALNIPVNAEHSIFLDSDLLLLQTWNPEQHLNSAPFSAKPADLATFGQDLETWQSVYQLFDLPFPQQRVISTISRQVMLPYFNAGFIAIQNGLKFAETWLDSCQRIEAATHIINKRPWLDQIALPITAARLNLTFNCLDERYNYPAHLKPLAKTLPYFVHYHYPHCLRREPRLNALVLALCRHYPRLKTILSQHPEWAKLLQPYQLTPKKRGWFAKNNAHPSFTTRTPEAFITGIPRSGTSYLCRLLHQQANCVVINEPSEIFPPLQDSVAYGIPLFYQELRRKILDNEGIENKIKDGEMIEDTALEDVRTLYYPQVSCPDFLLLTKNTLAYLSRISQLRSVMPHAPLIANIRHPLDTIASWKTTFNHLKTATLDNIPIGHLNDTAFSQMQRHRLQEVATHPNEMYRRALWWRFLAEMMLDNAWQLHTVKYEDLVLKPNETVTQIVQAIPNAPLKLPLKHLKASTLRHKREVLTAEEIEIIWAMCGQVAAEFGYYR